jgi:hypothetical protein
MTRLRVDFGAAGMDVWTRIPSSKSKTASEKKVCLRRKRKTVASSMI